MRLIIFRGISIPASSSRAWADRAFVSPAFILVLRMPCCRPLDDGPERCRSIRLRSRMSLLSCRPAEGSGGAFPYKYTSPIFPFFYPSFPPPPLWYPPFQLYYLPPL